MKKLVLILICFVLVSAKGFSQSFFKRFEFGLKAGANYSNFTNANFPTDPLVGFHAGATVAFKITDNFLVQDPFGRAFDDPDRLIRLRISFEDALANRNRLTDRLASKQSARMRSDAFDIEPVVLIDSRASNRYTVIEVNARDRPALLNALAHALFQSKVTIHSAHIATYGERAVDTFYLTDLTGDKIAGAARLKALERRLLAAAAGAPLSEAA